MAVSVSVCIPAETLSNQNKSLELLTHSVYEIARTCSFHKVNELIIIGAKDDKDVILISSLFQFFITPRYLISETFRKPVNDKKLDIHLNTTKIYLSLISWTSSKDDEIKEQKDIVIDSHSPSSFTLSVVLKDLKNEISILNTSQPLPMKWSKWIEGNFELNEEDVDPSDWVIGWFYNTLGNLIGITLQSYIIKRMGY